MKQSKKSVKSAGQPDTSANAATKTKRSATRAKEQPPEIVSSPTNATPAAAASGSVRQAAPTASKQPAADSQVSVKACVDVGFGNALYIRGEGAGLSWDRGIPMACAGADCWTWSTDRADGKVVFKLLLNDEAWAKGEDLTLRPGERLEVSPSF